MEIAFVSGNPHLPQAVGGVEVNTHALAGELMRRGHRVSVLAKLSLRTPFGWWRAVGGVAAGSSLAVDRGLGYPVFRARRPGRHAGALPRLDVAIVQNGAMLDLAAGFTRLGVPAVAYLHGLGFRSWAKAGGAAAVLPFSGYIANSRFTAGCLRQLYGIEAAVVPPLIRREHYLTPVDGAMVTMVNPVAVKGVDLALEIAALCPGIPFCLVRGWPLGLRGAAALNRRVRLLPNVELRGSAADMRTVYRDTRLLLVPSQWEDETWGRVVSEAQISGIPVIASNRGGLPEAVGPGGVILPYDAPAAEWAVAVRTLWSDAGRHRALSQAAVDHAARPELDPERQIDALIAALERCVA